MLGNRCEKWNLHGTRILHGCFLRFTCIIYHKAAPLVSGIIATIISLIGDRPPLMMTDILRKLCIRQGVVASSLRKLFYFQHMVCI